MTAHTAKLGSLIISGAGEKKNKKTKKNKHLTLKLSLTLLLVFIPGAQLYSLKSKWVREKWRWRWRLACLFFPITLICFKVGSPIFYRTQVSQGSDLWVLMSVSERPFADLIDLNLADEDIKSIPADDITGQS